MKMILMNGPPRSGKDSVARALYRKLIRDKKFSDVKIAALAAPMQLVASTICKTDLVDYETDKDSPVAHLNHDLGNDTLREFMIRFSEDFIKPRYGNDFWGEYLLADVTNPANRIKPEYIIVTDLGFIDEYRTMAERLGPGNVLVVHLNRDGFDWRNDSRSYIYPPLGHVKPLSVRNDYVEESAQTILDYTVNDLGW